jgi:hypothetical protein
MKCARLFAVVVGFAVLANLGPDAFARYRMYNPATGAFMQRDPLGTPDGPPMARNLSPSEFTRRDPTEQYADGTNLYQYVQSNPVVRTDPFGLKLRLSSQNTAQQNTRIMADLKKLAQGCLDLSTQEDRILGLFSHGQQIKYRQESHQYERLGIKGYCECLSCWRMLKSLIDSGTTVTIQAVGQRDPRFARFGPHYDPNANRIKVEAGADVPVADQRVAGRGRATIPSEVVLAHEGIHAQHDVERTLGAGRMQEEWQTVGLYGYSGRTTENKCRQELGYPLRLVYDPLLDSLFGQTVPPP